MCLLIHFVLKNVYVPSGNCKYYVSIFYKVWVIEFEHSNPISHKIWNIILWLFC